MIVKLPESKYTPAPEGSHNSVCVDVIDLGIVKTTWNNEEKESHKVRIVWQIDEEVSAGVLFTVRQDYTASLGEKANLRKMLESWRGKAFTDAELMGFDLEQLVGVPCMINVVHRTGSKGGTFANVAAAMRLPRSMNAMKPADYVRVKDREPQSRPVPQQFEEHRPDEITDDDVPF